MATLHAGQPPRTAEQAERRFFLIMALAMAGITVAGFVVNLAMGRSTFASPAAYHVHGVVFMGWIALYIAQAVTIASGRRALHIRLGKIAYLWIPLMVAMGIVIMVTVARRNGGPFFFAVNEFLVSNVALLLCFGGLALWALRRQRHNGWHRRLMLCSMAILTGPGLGRLLPMPLFMEWAWTIGFLTTLIFPAVAIVADLRRRGRVHPAYWWGTGLYAGTFVASMLLAFSPIGYAITDAVIAGTPGAERPIEPFMPPGFNM